MTRDESFERSVIVNKKSVERSGTTTIGPSLAVIEIGNDPEAEIGIENVDPETEVEKGDGLRVEGHGHETENVDPEAETAGGREVEIENGGRGAVRGRPAAKAAAKQARTDEERPPS